MVHVDSTWIIRFSPQIFSAKTSLGIKARALLKTICSCGGYKHDYDAFSVHQVYLLLTSVGIVDVKNAHGSLT